MTPDINQMEWGSHLPATLACMASTAGPVLELGVGHCSTPALHAYCLAAGRMVTSAEQNKDWFELFRSKYEGGDHRFIVGEYSDIVPSLAFTPWSVVLIDNSPGGDRRKSDFQSLIARSDFVVLHDYHRENQEAIEPLLNGLNHFICLDYDPPTLVASLTRNVPESLKT